MFQTLFAKEVREQWRTWRFVILGAVLLISGIASPILAKYTPVLLRSIPDLPPGLADAIPDPTLEDAVDQYVKNVSQFGLLLSVILAMGSVAQEKERGTAAMLLIRPVKRSAVVLAKWLVWVLTLAVGLLAAGSACVFYTGFLFEWLPLGEFLFLNLFLLFYLVVFVSLAILASSLARTQSMAAGGAFGSLFVILILSSLPRVDLWMPARLLAWGSALALRGDLTAWPSLWVSSGLVAVCLILSCWKLAREEI
jgi:ABC-2 type transport system permease protein